jgi:hypothetical protein
MVELRQGGQVDPGDVIGLPGVGVQREALDPEPIQVGRGSLVLEDVVELEETAAGVVEYAVQHHTDITAVGFRQQSVEGRAATQQRVDLVVIVGVVAVIGS